MLVMVGEEGGDGGGNIELREIMKATWEIRWKEVVLGQLKTRRIGEGDTSGNSGNNASFSSSNYAEVEGKGDGGRVDVIFH